MTSHRRRWTLPLRLSSSMTTLATTTRAETMSMLDALDENEEELWRLRRLVAPPLPTPAAIADLCPPPSSPAFRPRLKPPSLSSSTYRSDYKPSPVTLPEGSRARSLGLGSERGRSSERKALAAAPPMTAAARRRSCSPPRDDGGGRRCHGCPRCSSSSSSAAAAEALSAPPPPRPPSPSPPPPPINFLSPAEILSASFDSKENAPSSLQQKPRLLLQKQQQQLQRRQNQTPKPPQRTSRVSGSALSDALASFRGKETEWLAEKAALRREADAARRASLVSEGLRAREATARRHAEAELKAARAALRRRDDDAVAERERHAAELAGNATAAESRVRCAERAASLATCEAAEHRERVIALKKELAEERSRRGGAELERESAREGRRRCRRVEASGRKGRRGRRAGGRAGERGRSEAAGAREQSLRGGSELDLRGRRRERGRGGGRGGRGRRRRGKQHRQRRRRRPRGRRQRGKTSACIVHSLMHEGERRRMLPLQALCSKTLPLREKIKTKRNQKTVKAHLSFFIHDLITNVSVQTLILIRAPPQPGPQSPWRTRGTARP